MSIASRSFVVCLLVASTAGAEPVLDTDDGELRPPGSVESAPPPTATRTVHRKDPLATTERWGGGARFTGLSGIGALPGVNYGGELAGLVRHDEYFAELALAAWRPEKTYVLSEMAEHVELGLDVWTLRAGWASMTMPLRGWVLGEMGALAGPKGMAGVARMTMITDVPQERRWRALGGGFGVAWPMSDMTRLVGMFEVAVPIGRREITLDQYGAYQPDPLAARFSVGFEVGVR